jgi:hypothetical protein
MPAGWPGATTTVGQQMLTVLYGQALGWWDPWWARCFQIRYGANSSAWYDVSHRIMGMHTR